MSFTRSVALNTIVQLVGRVITTVLSLVLIAALTRYLGVNAFGVYTTVFVYVGFLGVLADLGFFWIMVRELAQTTERDRFNALVSNVLTLRTFLGIVVFGLGAFIAWFIPRYSGEIQIGIAIISLAWLATALNSTFVGVFQNKLRMDKAVTTDIIGRTVILIFTLWLVGHHAPLTTILWAYVAGTWLNLVISFFLGTRYVTVRPRFDFREWTRIFHEAFPMGIVIVLHVIYYRIDSVMLSLIKGPMDVGIYGAPYKVLDVLLTLPVMFLGNVFPTLTRHLSERSSSAPVLIQRSFDALLAIALPLTVGGIVLAEPIIRVVAGNDFVHATTLSPIWGIPATPVLTLQILMVAVGVSFISNIFGYTLVALGKQREMIRPYSIFVVVNVAINLAIIPSFSYIGAALSTVITELVVIGYFSTMALRATGVRLRAHAAWRIGLSTVAMTLALSVVRGSIWLSLLVGVVVYAIVVSATGVVNRGLIREILQGRR